MKVVYISGPFSGRTQEEIDAHVESAQEMAKQILLAGHVPIVAHRISANWTTDERFAAFTRYSWLDKLCLPILKKSDAILMLPEWERSVGAVIEERCAIENEIPIFYSLNSLLSAYPHKAQ